MPAPIRSVSDLLENLNAGQQLKYLFFWGHTRPLGAAVGKECFSQWYPAPFTIQSDTYATAEHYMMAEKARLFNDEATRALVLQAAHPDQAKNGCRISMRRAGMQCASRW